MLYGAALGLVDSWPLITSRPRKNPSHESQQPFFHFTAQKKSSKANGLAHNQYCSKITPRNAMKMLPAAATRKTSFLLSIVPPMVPNSGNDTPHRSSPQRRLPKALGAPRLGAYPSFCLTSKTPPRRARPARLLPF